MIFYNQKLQQAYESQEENIKKRMDRINQISEDIARLERIFVAYAANQSEVDHADAKIMVYWDGKRIMCQESNEPKAHPLVDCKAHVRLIASDLLPLLLSSCVGEVI